MRFNWRRKRHVSQDGMSAEQIPLSSPGKHDSSLSGPSLSKTSLSRHWAATNAAWKWELAACILSLVAIVAMVATLLTHANKSTPQWPFAITINALLSVFAMVLKAALMFVVSSCIMQLQWNWFTTPRPLHDAVDYDSAGRGSWGAISWLWAHHGREPLTAFGAIITILSMATDPFVQQLVRPVGCSVVMLDANATLARTNVFDYSSLQRQLQTFTMDLQDAVNVGALAPSNSTAMGCSTGNCTFPQTFGTLGWCSSCVDSSAQLSFDLTCASYNEANDTIGAGQTMTDTSQCGKNATDVFAVIKSSLPTGINTTYANPLYSASQQAPDADRLLCSMRSVTELADPGCASDSGSDCYEDLNIQIVAGKVLFYQSNSATDVADTSTMVYNSGINPITQQMLSGCDITTTENDWQCRGYGAANCTLQPCVREYSASIQNGQVLESPVGRSAIIPLSAVDDSPELDLVGMIDTRCISDGERVLLEQEGFVAIDSERWLSYNITTDEDSIDILTSDDYIFRGSGNATLLSSLLERQCLYLVDVPAMRTLLDALRFNIFNADLLAIGYEYGSFIDNAQVSVFRIARVDGPDCLQHMYSNGNISFDHVQRTFENISEALTQHMRVTGNLNFSEPAVGQIFHYDTCLDVRWEWLAFPATLTSLGLTFFAMAVMSTAQKGAPVWKSSPLVWIFHGPKVGTFRTGSEGQQDDSVVITAKSIEEKSKQLLVTLVRGQDPQLKLVGPEEMVNKAVNEPPRICTHRSAYLSTINLAI